MKPIKTYIFRFLVFFLSLFAVGITQALNVEGHITNLTSGQAIAGHTVFILVDEAGAQGFSYFNKLTTDNNGYYADSFFIPQGLQLSLIVTTFDCNMVPMQQSISIAQQQYTFDFQLCAGLTGCHAWFSSHALNPNPLRITFRNFSVGNINTYHWDFGDGTTAVNQDPVHFFPQAGVYVVSLTVSHSNPTPNCISTYVDTIQVGNPLPPCQAAFSAWPNVSNPMKWHFQQQSTGTIHQYKWDFGDGTTAIGQNTMHVYSDTGLYNVCHIIWGPLCQDTFCQWVHVSSPGYYNLAGQVFTGLFPADAADVMLFRKVNNNYMLDQTASADSLGVYYFYQILSGQYILRAFLKQNATQYGKYLPSYHHSTPFWSSAIEIGLQGNNYDADIVLKPFPVPQPGPGGIGGQVIFSDTNGGSGPAPEVEVLLLNPAGHAIGATWSLADGSFSFPGIKLGQYQIHAEVPGIPSQLAQVHLTTAQPTTNNITLEVQPMMVLAIQAENLKDYFSVQLIPNPFHDICMLELDVAKPIECRLTITSLNGQNWLVQDLSHMGGRLSYPLHLSHLPAGLYLINVIDSTGQGLTKKVLKLP